MLNECNAFGTILRNHRTKVGLSQEKLALLSNLDRSFVSLLERGMRQPTLKTMLLLVDALDVSFESFAADIERALHENS
ncbi:MAG: helix-turn-helix transcriptional regulator [Kiritimatiellia bacterium]|jgi:transcriptional regulator with XRE-family HTH domain|nr:helix-turn-helix transcriptional regulator [Kiritimatiellia bacterium]